MTPGKDEQARQRLVEIALQVANRRLNHLLPNGGAHPLSIPDEVRKLAGFKNPRKGHWCAAGLTAAMEDAGLLVPAPGTPARRGAIALMDWVASTGCNVLPRVIGQQWNPDTPNDGTFAKQPEPGDIIAWLQHPPPDPAGWRRGHAAVIVAVDDESVTTVGWNEGPSPGRVMMRRLWRDQDRKCHNCKGDGAQPSMRYHGPPAPRCTVCYGTGRVRPIETVQQRRSGGPYGVARPVAA